MHLETDLAEPVAVDSQRFDQVVAAAERHARKIVRDAEDEACRILEDAAAVAFRSKGDEAARPRRYAVITLLLAGCALAATAGLVVGIAIGQM